MPRYTKKAKTSTKLKKKPASASPQPGKHDSNRASTPENDHSVSHVNSTMQSSKHSSCDASCIICHLPVLTLATQCDRCKSYTHIECDANMNRELHDVLDKYPDNPLIYFCSICKPKIYEYSSVEKYLDRALKRLDTVVHDTNAAQEFQLDLMVKAFTARVGSLESISSDLREQQSVVIERMEHLESLINHATRPNTQAQGASTTHASNRSDNLATNPTSSLIQASAEANHDAIDQTINHSTHANISSDAMPSSSNQLGTPPNIHFMRSALSQLSHCQQLPSLTQNQNHMRYQGPPSNQNHMRYQGPPLTRQTFKPPDPPNPETSIVVYNIPTSSHPYQVIAELASECSMMPSDIVSVQRLPTSRSNPPIAVTCSDSGTKWYLLRNINKKENQMYAKPFLTEDDRRKDRQLVVTLKSVRDHNPGHKFKISKGKICELIDNELVSYTANPTETQC